MRDCGRGRGTIRGSCPLLLLSSRLELGGDGGDGRGIEDPGGVGKDGGFFHLDVGRVDTLQCSGGGEQLGLVGGAERGGGDPFAVKGFDLMVELLGAAVIVFEMGEVVEV